MSRAEDGGADGACGLERAVSRTGAWGIGGGEKECRWLVDFGGEIFEIMLRID